MQVPRRRSEQGVKRDSGPFFVTEDGLRKLQIQLEKLEARVPELIAEVEYTKSHGDFSENAAYQDAKHNLRRTYGRMENIKDRLKRAEIIRRPDGSASGVQLGSRVVVEVSGKQHAFEILGSHESDPGRGRISNGSPLGQALMGHKVGDEVPVLLATGTMIYKIVEIS